MTETVAENQICNSCGVEVRKGALFCYNCGGSVAPAIVTPKDNKIDGENRISAKEDNNENGNEVIRVKLKNKAENESALPKEIAERPIPKPVVKPETKLKSAASLRKKSKVVQKKKVEIIWEEYENAPNGWFILATILLTIFAVGIMWMALYFG